MLRFFYFFFSFLGKRDIYFGRGLVSSFEKTFLELQQKSETIQHLRKQSPRSKSCDAGRCRRSLVNGDLWGNNKERRRRGKTTTEAATTTTATRTVSASAAIPIPSIRLWDSLPPQSQEEEHSWSEAICPFFPSLSHTHCLGIAFIGILSSGIEVLCLNNNNTCLLLLENFLFVVWETFVAASESLPASN